MVHRQPEPALVAERLLQVIDEGQRTATYKLALLLALIDALAEAVDADGTPPATLHTRTIAEHVVRIYYPQVRPYVASEGDEEEGPHVLRQITNKRSVTIRAVYRLRLAAGGAPLGQAITAHPAEYESCLDTVEQNFARYPIRLLQVVGTADTPFLYDVDWGESVGLRSLHAPSGGLLHFRPGVAGELLRLVPVIRPLVELHWTRQVAQWNRLDLEGDRLHAHLFGAHRVGVPKILRATLVDLQQGDCFYCGGRLGPTMEVDHFMPWSRWPNNAIENLVAADRRCNNDKRDRLAATEHVDRWSSRLEASAADLAAAAADAGWETAPARSVALARAGYNVVPAGTPLWVGGNELADVGLERIRTRLAGLAA